MSSDNSAAYASLRESFVSLYVMREMNNEISLSNIRTQARKYGYDAVANKLPSYEDPFQVILDIAEVVDHIFEAKSPEDIGKRFDVHWKQEWV